MEVKGIILDLDETIIDTRCLKEYRNRRDWQTCYRELFKTKMYPDSEIFLEACISKKIKIGIVTMSPRPYAERILMHFKIPFNALISYHDVVNRKPHSEPMLKCAEVLNLNPNEIIAIGDDIKDVMSSKNAGMYSIGVSWGVSTPQELKIGGAHLVLDSFHELTNLLMNVESFKK